MVDFVAPKDHKDFDKIIESKSIILEQNFILVEKHKEVFIVISNVAIVEDHVIFLQLIWEKDYET